MSLTRKSCLFSEQDNEEVPQWIYSCQCDKARSDLYEATGRSIRMTHEGTLQWTVLFFISIGVFYHHIILN